jgi:DNA repair protein RecO
MIAVILKKTDIDEHDQLVSCYSSELGKYVFVAKSALRSSSKQALHLDLLNLVEFSPIEGKSKMIITGADSVETFRGIKGSIRKLANAFLVLEVFDKLVPYAQVDEGLWDFLMKFLYGLERIDEKDVIDYMKETKSAVSNILGYGEEDLDILFADIWGGKMNSLKFIKQLNPEF